MKMQIKKKKVKIYATKYVNTSNGGQIIRYQIYLFIVKKFFCFIKYNE